MLRVVRIFLFKRMSDESVVREVVRPLVFRFARAEAEVDLEDLGSQ